MKLTKFWNSKGNTVKLTRRDEILKRIEQAQEVYDKQLPCKKQYNAVPEEANIFMQKQICTCTRETIDGILQCQYGCSCSYFRKTCSIDCACEGMCIPNTLLHLPENGVRLGIAGDELYAEEDIDSGRLAFVFTGEMTSIKRYFKTLKEKQYDLYKIIGKWQGEGLYEIGKDGVPTFVINTFKEIAGFANHSCDPNIEVFEIWQNGKLYVVGKTMKYCFTGDTLTYDYNWEWNDDAKFAEICLCGSKNCRAFIAKVSPIVMGRSIPRYVAILNEMETHNIYESQRLDRLQTTFHTNLPLTTQEKLEAQTLKQDTEELRLTKRKAILLKKGILMAKAKLAELESAEVIERDKFSVESKYAQSQTLFDSDDERDKLSMESKYAQSQALLDSNDEVDSVSVASSQASRISTPNSIASSSSRKFLGGKTSRPRKNPKEHCVSESRITQALKNDGLPLSVRVPLPLKDSDQCVLMGVQDIDKLLIESKIQESESTRNNHSFLQMPKCSSPSCLPLTQSQASTSARSTRSDSYSINTQHLKQYDSAMKTNRINEIIVDPSKIKAIKGKGKATTHSTPNDEDEIKNVEDWGEGLFTQDEINRIFSWIEGTIHARGRSSQFQPWPKAREWAFWLHKNFRHPTPIELENHKKTWIGMSTKTLRAGGSGKEPTSKTLPLVRDVRTLLSDVLTFIPFKFSGFDLIESQQSGNIWRIVWNETGKPLPGNPTLREAG